MKEIKRYNEDIIYQKYNKEEFYAGMVCEDDGTWMEYTDHKAVVETMKLEDLRKQELSF